MRPLTDFPPINVFLGSLVHDDFPKIFVTCEQLKLSLNYGDKLWLRSGHVTSRKYSREAYNHRVTELPGGFLEDVTLCIISHS
jgi:hypothetical protein